MRVSVTEAKGRLTELVRRSEAGDEVVLTRHGRAAVKPGAGVAAARCRCAARGHRPEEAAAAGKRTAGASAARSQDFLYGGDGLPQGSQSAPPR